MSHPAIAALRSLVDARFPPTTRKPVGDVPTGVAALDAALGGGLPAGRLTELVAPPASGGQLVFAQLLRTTRAARQRVALVDAADSFAPEAIPADALRHLVWVRPRQLAAALAATDVLVRDGNYAAVVLDLRGVPGRELDRTPKTLWHRLHRAAANQPGAVLVLTAFPVVPSVPWRLALSAPRSPFASPTAVGPGSARVPRAILGVPPRISGGAGGTPTPARETRALPGREAAQRPTDGRTYSSGFAPDLSREHLVAQLTVATTRGHAALVEELAG